MFRIFWSVKIVTEKRLPMLPIVCMPQTRMPLIAVVPSDLRLKLSIPILGNFASTLTKPVALATGIVCWVLVILLLLFQFKFILRLYLRSNCVHISSLSRRSRIFYQSFCSWQGSEIERWWIHQSVFQAFLFWRKSKHSLKLFSSARIEVLIWDVWKLQKLCVFLKTMVFCSTMFEAILYKMAPLVSLEFVAT